MSKKKKQTIYWSEDTESAIVEYLKRDVGFYQEQLKQYEEEKEKEGEEPDSKVVEEYKNKIEYAKREDVVEKKSEIFKDKIEKPINKLVENIMFNYKLFPDDVDTKTLHGDCLTFIYERMSKFDPSYNKKAFSYLGTIAKHYLLGKKTQSDKNKQSIIDIDENKEEVEKDNYEELDDISNLEISKDLFSEIIEEINQELKKNDISENDKKVGEAILIIFKKHELIGFYNKTHLYKYIKEITDLETKDITYSLHRFRKFYRKFKKEFLRRKGIS